MATGPSPLKPFSTLLQTNNPQNEIPGDWQTGVPYAAYFHLSGTSMAAPMVSGAAALLIQKDSTLTPDQVKARLMKTASKAFPAVSLWVDPKTKVGYRAYSDMFTVGAGYLDIMAALNSTEKIAASQSAKSPKAAFANGKAVLSYDASDSGAKQVAGGTMVVWGNSVVWGDAAPFSEATAIQGEP